MKNNEEQLFSFWDHLEALRQSLLRIVLVLLAIFVLVFSSKDFVFDSILLPPLHSDFWLYRSMCVVSEWLQLPSLCPSDFQIQLINIELSGQFLAHLSSSFGLALALCVPYVLFEIWRFVQPALYPKERKSFSMIFLSASFLFYLGAAVSYFLVFPLTIRFLGTYELSANIPNHISIQSYLGALYILIFSLGIMFELPVLAYLLSKAGLIHKEQLKKVRKYAFVIILIVAALITPTTDPFTMMFVAMPVYLLYELSIVMAKKRKVEYEDE
jgi:sec-independent protein translocase protein TatC